MSETTSPRPHRGVLVLVFGIIGLIGACLPLGIAAWIMGWRDLKAIDRGAMDGTGRGMTKAGMILGIISVPLLLFLYASTIAWPWS